MIKTPYNVNDRFELLELLGSGNFSEVYLARDLDPGNAPELVAFKLFRSLNRGRGFEHSLSSFEFQMLSRLRHPNLATVYDYGVDPGSGRAWFTMERLSGVDFLEAVAEMQPLETLPLVVAACRALHHIHTRGLIHHDLKPGNLIITHRSPDGSPLDQPVVKLTDFGLSTSFEKADDGHLRGTPEYMAPEMLAGLEKDHRCDLYSLGVLLYISLSGRLPFPDGRRPGTEMDSPPQLRGRNNEPLPAFLEDLVDRLLKADPDQRYQTANEVIRDLGLYTGTAWAMEPGAVGASSADADTVLTISKAQMNGLRTRLEHLGSASPTEYRPAVIIGTPGAGKSHLVMELRRLAQTSGAGFLFFSPPEGAMTQTSGMDWWMDNLLRQTRRIRRGHDSGVVVVLDVEELGFTTVSGMLKQLEPLTAKEQIFALVTATTDQPATDRLLKAHPHGDTMEHIHLRPLDSARMVRFLSTLLGSQVKAGDSLTSCVLDESDGNPRLAEETVNHLQASGALTLHPTAPEFDVVRHRMDINVPSGNLLVHHGRAAAEAGSVSLQALAVFCAPATARMVAELAGEEEEEATRELTGAAEGLLVSETSEGATVHRFRSLFARNLVRRSLGRDVQRQYHHRAARALEQGLPTPGIAPGSRTWQHLMLAGDTTAAWTAGLAHGRQLEEAQCFAEAFRVYETLIDHGGAEDVPPELAAGLTLQAAGLLRAAGKTTEAGARLKYGLAVAQRSGNPELLARFRLETGYKLEKQGELDRALETYLQGLEGLSGLNSPIRIDLLIELGLCKLRTGQFDEAEQYLADCREACRSSRHPGGEESCLLLEAFILKSRQQPDAAVDLLRQRLTGKDSSEDTIISGRLRNLLGDLLYHQNRFDEAARLFSKGMTIFRDRGERSLEAIAMANLGALHFEQGQFSRAGRFNLDCLRSHEQIGNRYGQALSRYNLGVCDYHRGRYAEALEHLRAAQGIYEFLGDAQGLGQGMNMEAELYLTLGDTASAVERLQSCSAVLRGDDSGYTEADRLLLEAESMLRTGRAEAAETLCGQARTLFTTLGDTRQQARTAMLLCRCLIARGLTADAEQALAAARDLTVSMNVPRLHAELLLTASELRRQSGLGPTHAECAGRCRDILEQLNEVEDPEFLHSLYAALGWHLAETGHNEEGMSALNQAFELLRKVAGGFGSQHAEWKSGYLSAPHRAEVIRKVAHWSRKNNPSGHSSNS